jgi:hypothetical protein
MQVCGNKSRPNNRINSDWQFRCAPLPAGYAERWAPIELRNGGLENREEDT